MENYITETNRDNLCDMLWWLKGYKKGADSNFEECPFSEDHLKTLDDVVRGMREELNKEEKKKIGSLEFNEAKQELKFTPTQISLKDQLKFIRDCIKLPNNQKSKIDIYEAIEQTIFHALFEQEQKLKEMDQ